MKKFTLLAILLAFVFGAKANPDTPPKDNTNPEFEIMAKYYPDSQYEHSAAVRVLWGASFKDFETVGADPLEGFINDSLYPWVVTSPDSVQGFNGNFCLKSGNKGIDSSSSSIQIPVYFNQPGSVSFLAGCYGEGTNWDVCEFYIDDEVQFSNGNLNTWETYSFEVTSGTHVFKWSYTKDNSVNSTVDAFFVDDIIFMGVSSLGDAGSSYNLYYRPYLTAAPSAPEPTLVAQGVTGNQYIYEDWADLDEGDYQFGIENPSSESTSIFWSNAITKSTVDYFTVSVMASPVTGGTVTGDGTFAYGESCTVTATLNDGYTFEGWLLNNEELGIQELEYTFSVKGNVVIEAVFSPIGFDTWFSSIPEDGGIAELVDHGSVIHMGEELTIDATANEGYSFLYWSVGVSGGVKGGGNRSIEMFSCSPTYTFTFDQDFWEAIYADTLDIMAIEFIAYFTDSIGNCARPSSFAVSDIGKNSATLSWTENGTSDSWSVAYRPVVIDPTTAPVGYTYIEVTENTLTLDNLNPDTEYMAYVFPSCAIMATGGVDESLISNTIRFTTLEACPKPHNVTVTNVTGTTATLTWADDNDSYRVQLGQGDILLNENFENFDSSDSTTVWLNETNYAWTVVDGHFQSGNAGVASSQSRVSITLNFTADGVIEFDAECRGEGLGSYEIGNEQHQEEDDNVIYDICSFEIDEEQQFAFGASRVGWHHYSFEVPAGQHTFTWSYEKDSSADNPGDYFAIDNVLVRVGEISWNNPIPTEEAEITLTGLNPTTSYFVQVQGICEDLSTPWSAPIFFTTTEETSHEITATAYPANAGSVTGAGTYEHGARCTLTAIPATGYHFVAWTLNSDAVADTEVYTFDVMESAEYVAVFELNAYYPWFTIIPEAGGSVAIVSHDADSTIYYGDQVTVAATPEEGFGFVNWTTHDTDSTTVELSTEASFTFVMNEAFLSNFIGGVDESEIEFIANFELGSYEIIASANPANTGSVSGAGAYSNGTTCTLTATAAEGYTFVNWTENGQEVSTASTYEFEVTGERTLVANFSLNSYAITATADPAVGGTVEGAGTYEHFATATLTATAAEGYTFVNWTENGQEVSTASTYEFEVTGERTLVANFSLNSYAITATADPAVGGTVEGTGTYEHFATATLTATAATGYTFVNWTENGQEVSTAATYEFEVTGERTLVANFVLNSYAIAVTANPTTGGTVTGANTYDHFATATLTATANTGYTFVNWTENGQEVSTASTYEFEVTGERTLVANFSLNSYAITATADPAVGGSVEGAGTYEHFATATLTATANTGYTFVNWTENGQEVSTAATYEFEVTGERTLVANFSLNSYAITATADPAVGGSVEGAGTYEHFATATLTATANTGYTFVNWTENGQEVSTAATYEFEVTGERTLVANFGLNSYAIAATADPAGGGTVEGAGTYEHFATATLTATATTGYIFVNWTENGQEVSTASTYEFEVTGARTLVANFELNSYAIAATADPAVGGTVEGAGTYEHFATATLTATAATGYTFVNWTENGSQVSADATYSFTVTGARTLVANFTINSYVVSASIAPENSGTITGAGGFEYGETATLTVTAATGYTFMNWTENGQEVSTASTYEFEVTGERTLVANFSLNSYAIATTANPTAGGTVTGANTYDHFATATLTATAATGYTFVNWTENGQEVSTSANYSFEVTGARTLVANFVLNSYAIAATANPTAGGTVTGANTYDHFATATLTATAATGYTFVNWTENGQEVSTSANYSFEVTGARTLVANFSLNSYAIAATANPTAGGTVTGANTYDHFATATLTATAATGYTFVNWTENGQEVSTSANYSFEVTGARTLVANFSLNSYAIAATANPTAGGNVTGAGTYNHFATCILTAEPATGYHFLNWTKNGQVFSTNTSISFTVTGEATYVANFEINSYDITAMVTANPSNGGSVNGTGTFTYGQTCTLTAVPATGYHFLNWTKNGQVFSTNPTISFTVTETATYVANFEIDSFDITAMVTVNPSNGGSVNGTGTFNYGQTCTLIAVPATGYHFVNWTKNGQVISTNTTISFTVTEEATYVANFEINSYDITAMVTTNPSNGGSVNGTGTFTYGQTCTLTAVPATGYHFLNWTKNGQVISTNTTISFTVTETATYVANFEIDSFDITAMVTANPSNGGSVNGTGTFTYGQTCTLTAVPTTGYHFLNWMKNGQVFSTDLTISFTVTETATYVANFEIDSFDITAMVTVNPSNGGSVSGTGTFTYGQTCTLTAVPTTGYHFVNWTKNGVEVSINATYSFTVTEAAAYVANFEINSYTIIAYGVPANSGTITGGGAHTYGSTCTLTATPNIGYYFVKWTKGLETVSTEPVYSFEVTESATYRAHFAKIAYTVSAEANPEEGGTITGTGDMFYYNTNCQLIARANRGYHFVNWTLDGVEVSTSYIYNFTVTESVHYLANFEPDLFEITAIANPEEGGTVTGAGTYPFGQMVTLTAEANMGYHFVNWTMDGVEVSTSAVYEFVIDGAAQFEANFALDTFEITVIADPEEGGVVTGAGTYAFGQTVTLTAVANTDFRFAYWTENDEIVSEEATWTFTAEMDRNLVAHFTNTVGVVEHDALTVSLYPNPVRDKLTIEASEPVKSVEVYTINGLLVSKQDNYSEKIEINVESYAFGTYMIRITTENTVEIRKFVKE